MLQVPEAVASPISSQKLCNLAKGKINTVVIISDHTSPVPSRYIILYVLNELRAGNPEVGITILVTTGGHRGTIPDDFV